MSTEGNREQRRAARAEGDLDTAAFMKAADKFIDVANRENRKVNATELHLAFLWASARYSAHVAVNVAGADDHEAFVQHMVAQYAEMLRQNLADPSVAQDG